MDWLLANVPALIFYLLAAVAVAGAIGVIAFSHPVHAALSLLAKFLAVAGLFVLQHAEFIAAVQILIYADGVMVLFLFVIMLVNVRHLPEQPQYLRRFDQANLDDLITPADGVTSTTEILTYVLWRLLVEGLPSGRLVRLRVEETPNNFFELDRGDRA